MLANLVVDKNAACASPESADLFAARIITPRSSAQPTPAAPPTQKMEQADLLAELSKAWQSVPYLSLALIVSAWTIGVFGLSILLDDCGDGESAADAITKLARRREFMKSHVV